MIDLERILFVLTCVVLFSCECSNAQTIDSVKYRAYVQRSSIMDSVNVCMKYSNKHHVPNNLILIGLDSIIVHKFNPQSPPNYTQFKREYKITNARYLQLQKYMKLMYSKDKKDGINKPNKNVRYLKGWVARALQ